MNPDRSTRVRSALSLAFTGVIASVIAAAAGSAATRLIAPSVRNRYFPWITGRALGIAAYLALTALVMLGAWMRHPWRLRRPFVHAEARLRAHAVLAVATVILVVGHISALAADSYAGVGWWGALIPGKSHYRTLPVALGVVGFWAMVLLTMTAGLAGRRGTTHWLVLHRFAALTFVSVWLHGVLSGTDTWRLRVLYLVTGLVIVALVLTRAVVSASAVRVERFVVAQRSQASGSNDVRQDIDSTAKVASGLRR